MSVQKKNLSMDNQIQIHDNFLDPEDLTKIKDLMVSEEGNFQWYFSDRTPVGG